MVYTTSVTDRSTFGNRQVKYSIYAGQAGPPVGPAGRRPRWRGGPRSDRHREMRPRVKPYVGEGPYRIPRYQDTHGPPAGWKPNKGCEICGDHASECEQMFWLFLERGTRSPDASKIPVDEIVEEWRSRSSRGRYEHAMWTAAGLEEPRSRSGKSRRGENPPGQQRSTEHAPLRATRPWTTCARAPAVAVSGRALRLSLASHPDLPSTFIWYTGLALGLIKL